MDELQTYKLLRGSDVKVRLWKILNSNMIHYNYKYHVGLNVLKETFNPSGDCKSGGLYVTWCPWRYLSYGAQIAEVKLPLDAQVWASDDKLKTDKLILGVPTKFEDANLDWLAAVKYDGLLLRYVRNQTDEIVRAAVGQNVDAITQALMQPEDVCQYAIRCNVCLFKHIGNPSLHVSMEAIRKDPFNIYYVKRQTPELCMLAVSTAAHSLVWVKEQTPELCAIAVARDGMLLQHVKRQTPELCMTAVRQNGLALRFARRQTLELCLAAVQQNGLALQDVKEQTYEICRDAMVQNPDAYKYATALPTFCTIV